MVRVAADEGYMRGHGRQGGSSALGDVTAWRAICFEGNVLGCEILGGLRNRKLEGQSGTGAERAVGFNYAAMEFDDALSNRQA